MAFLDNIPHALRSVFDDGLDEVLIFAVVFIFILLSGHETGSPVDFEDNSGILPLLIIAAFLLLFAGFSRSEEGIT
jgi:hypothetical protein